jgi:hypothetical protein
MFPSLHRLTTRMRPFLPILTLLVLTCGAQDTDQHQPIPFDAKPWLEDFHQILAEMSSHYANLEYAVEDRKMDLPRLRLEAESKLREAGDKASARKVIGTFLSSFGDGHLELRWDANTSPGRATNAPVSQDICKRMGYDAPLRPGVDFSSFGEFSSVDTIEARLFPGGLLRLPHGPILGVIRIGLFSEHAYPQICQQAARGLHLAESSQCDDKCGDQLEIATANLLTAALVKRAEALRSAGAAKLLVDITNNGGGSDWVDAAVRAVAQVPLHDARMGFIKHEHWTEQLQDRLQSVDTDIEVGAHSPIDLNAAEVTLKKAIAASRERCDLNGVWQTGSLSCSLVVKDLLFASGIVDYAKPGTLNMLTSKSVLFQPSLYAYVENPRALPLAVLIDRNTWSAAEYFAALLQDNHAATIIGEVTGGAGCGYTNGGIAVTLKNSGARLKMPDCVRFRADGSNENQGITPDVLLPWSAHDSDFEKTQKLLERLEAAPKATSQPRSD